MGEFLTREVPFEGEGFSGLMRLPRLEGPIHDCLGQIHWQPGDCEGIYCELRQAMQRALGEESLEGRGLLISLLGLLVGEGMDLALVVCAVWEEAAGFTLGSEPDCELAN